MPIAIFDEMKAYVGFGEQDAKNLRELGLVLLPTFPRVVGRFYAVLLRHPGAARVFSGPAQIERLRVQLNAWLKTLFGGVYDSAYCVQRSEIGRAHVRVGLSQHYMFAAMEVIRQELQGAIVAARVPDQVGKLESLHKILALEIGIMLETYKESYSEQVRDIERIALRERLARAEQLAQIGQMAASLAHEIKNPLAGISGAVQVIRDAMPASDGRQPVLAEILRQIERLDGTVEDLLVYARPKPPNLRRSQLNDVIERTITLLQTEPKMQGIQLARGGATDLPEVDADPDQIEQVLMNVILNAAHASAPGQSVCIVTSSDDEGIAVAIEDRGVGMTEAVRQRALEPFFTTKARGTGLGLAICQQIIFGHGGTIDIRSAPSEGTTITLWLPLRRLNSNVESDNVNTRTDR